ncbi:8270_t:CDS:2 [Cetraspora pellucida]|uniref:8270_t:CDS:1 n=1 Tax=Cetraspora pellucida TaxID=1433469 RepID=A0ACA9LG77_9GLOM|nr:8270_t:CDS:2 [Cetraspora pellucida]
MILMMKLERIIYSGDCESLNLAIASYKALASSSLNANEAIKYLDRKVLKRVLNKWVGVYTSRIMHLGSTTTQCVEGAHSAMKHTIESLGSLTKSFNSLDRWLRLHHEERLLQYENKSINIDPLLTLDDKNRLEPLLEKVAQFALNKIKNELLKATIYKACLCSVMLSVIPKRWLLFPDKDQNDSNYLKNNPFSTNSDNFLLKNRLYEIETQYINFPDKQQKSTLLKNPDNILTVPETKLSEIKIPEKIIEKILLNSRIPANDIDQVYDPKSDGNCGFRALAFAIRGNEENWKSQASPCLPSLWFLSPDCAQLAADTFSVPIAIFDEDNEKCAMFYPLESAPILRKTLIILHFVNSNHIVYVGMKSYAKVNWPMVNLEHIPICHRYGLEDYWSKLFA